MSEPGRLQRDYDSFENENLNIGVEKIGHSFSRRERPASRLWTNGPPSILAISDQLRHAPPCVHQSLPPSLETFTLFDPPPELEREGGGGGGIETDVQSKYFLTR